MVQKYPGETGFCLRFAIASSKLRYNRIQEKQRVWGVLCTFMYLESRYLRQIFFFMNVRESRINSAAFSEHMNTLYDVHY